MKWGILIKVLPATAVFICAKSIVFYLGWEIWAFDALTAALFSAATFTIALVLSGTLADYRFVTDCVAIVASAKNLS